jgi:hypothetical protein
MRKGIHFAGPILMVLAGCAAAPAPQQPAATPKSLAMPAMPPPDPAAWKGKSFGELVETYTASAHNLETALGSIQTAADAAASDLKERVRVSAESLRMSRFGLHALSATKESAAAVEESRAAVNAATERIGQAIGRVMQVDGAMDALRESLLLIRTAPAPLE